MSGFGLCVSAGNKAWYLSAVYMPVLDFVKCIWDGALKKDQESPGPLCS